MNLPKIGVIGCKYELNTNINDLAGLNLKKLALLSDEETGIGFLRSKEKVASKKVIRDYFAELADCADIPLMTKIRKGSLGYNFNSTATNLTFKITNFKLEKYYKTTIRSISFVSSAKKLKGLVVVGGETISSQHTITKGLNKIDLNYVMDMPTVEITLNSCGIQIATGSSCNCYDTCYCQDFDFEFQKDGTTASIDGICVEFTRDLDEEAIICEIEHHLEEALLYATGIEIAKEAIVSDQVDWLVQSSKRDLERLLASWSESYDPVTNIKYTDGYKTILKNVVKRTKHIVMSEVQHSEAGLQMVTII